MPDRTHEPLGSKGSIPLKNNQTEIKRGGARSGAGRKAGSPNKASIARQAEIAASGVTPLDFMLSILRDETKPTADRFEAAKHAAPYVHPKLSSVEAKVEADLNATITMVELVSGAG